MPKYLIANPDNPEEYRVDKSDEARNIAYALALGADPEECGVDALEAGFLISHVREYAVEFGRDNLITSCNKALEAIMLDIQLFVINLEKK